MTGERDASAQVGTDCSPATPETVLAALKKVLAAGRLNRIPRHPEHRDILLALICVGMHRRYPYSEAEMNGCLQDALTGLHARVDHVTCRRYLVDLGFLRRDRAGIRYFVNYPRVESVLSEEAMVRGADLITRVLAEHRRRRQSHRERKGTP